MSDTTSGAELENAVRFILEKSARETLSGSYIINADDFPAGILSPGAFSSNISVIADMLYDYGAVADADITPDGAIDLNLYLAYCPNYERLPGEEDEFPDDREIFDPLLTKRESAVEQPALNESEQNFAAWLAVTGSSRFRWVEDEIYRLNGRGAMYYTGGEDGVYMRIGQDGKLEAGRYEGAIPHIGEAFFKPAVTKQFDSFSEAFQAAMEAGGKQFMVDMFSGPDRQPLTHIVSQKEKPSVLEQLRNAKSDHPCAPKVQGRYKHHDGFDR